MKRRPQGLGRIERQCCCPGEQEQARQSGGRGGDLGGRQILEEDGGERMKTRVEKEPSKAGGCWGDV